MYAEMFLHCVMIFVLRSSLIVHAHVDYGSELHLRIVNLEYFVVSNVGYSIFPSASSKHRTGVIARWTYCFFKLYIKQIYKTYCTLLTHQMLCSRLLIFNTGFQICNILLQLYRVVKCNLCFVTLGF